MKKITPDEAAKEWLELETEAKRIEARFDELQKVLDPVLERTKDKYALFHGFKFKVIEFEKENFSLALARKSKLIPKRILKKFVSFSDVRYIRTYFAGGKEE
jgi:hypothetical protein